MREFGKKRRGRAYQISVVTAKVAGVVALFVLAVLTSRGAWGMYEKFAEASEGRHTAEAELQALLLKKEGIEASVEGLTSQRGIEAELRERFGVAKAGEGEIRIVRDEEGDIGEAGEPQNLWEWVVETFFVW